MGFEGDSACGAYDGGDAIDSASVSDAYDVGWESDLYETADASEDLLANDGRSQWSDELYETPERQAGDDVDTLFNKDDKDTLFNKDDEALDRTLDPETRPAYDPKEIDFSKTMNTQEELATLRDMEAKGEIDVLEVDPTKPEPEMKAPNLPTERTGSFEGELGNSEFTPHSEAALEKMAEYGRSSVEYRDGYPDFSPFTSHQSPFGELNCEVEIGHMTPARQNPSWEFGRRPEGAAYDLNYDLGNFNQADIALSDRIFESHPEMIEGKTPDEIKGIREGVCRELADFRKSSNLTWHECADGKTMQLVPTEIHSACRHSGGVSHMKTSMAYGDVTLEV